MAVSIYKSKALELHAYLAKMYLPINTIKLTHLSSTEWHDQNEILIFEPQFLFVVY